VLEAGHTSIPNLVLLHYAELGVTAGELVFMTLCLQLKWSKGNPHPSLATIAERMAVSRRQVRTYAASLKAKGLLAVEERIVPERGQLSSVYDFTPFLEAVVKLDDDDGIPPGKDSSEGGRKLSSEGPGKDPSDLKEDEEQEDKVMQSSRFTTFRKEESAPAPAKPANNHSVSFSPAPPLRREPQSLAELLRSRVPPQPSEPVPRANEERQPWRYAERPYLDSIIRGVSQIFGDGANTDANLVRAHRLQERYRLDEETFTQCVFRARSLVKERRLSRRGGSLRRPGAYFFTILEDLANEASAARSSQNGPFQTSKPAAAHVGQPGAKLAM
jgi:hypothetical protein